MKNALLFLLIISNIYAQGFSQKIFGKADTYILSRIITQQQAKMNGDFQSPSEYQYEITDVKSYWSQKFHNFGESIKDILIPYIDASDKVRTVIVTVKKDQQLYATGECHIEHFIAENTLHINSCVWVDAPEDNNLPQILLERMSIDYFDLEKYSFLKANVKTGAYNPDQTIINVSQNNYHIRNYEAISKMIHNLLENIQTNYNENFNYLDMLYDLKGVRRELKKLNSSLVPNRLRGIMKYMIISDKQTNSIYKVDFTEYTYEISVVSRVHKNSVEDFEYQNRFFIVDLENKNIIAKHNLILSGTDKFEERKYIITKIADLNNDQQSINKVTINDHYAYNYL